MDDIGGGTASGRPVKAVQVGGPLGAYFPRALFDTPFDYESFAARGGLIGHGGIVVFDDTVDMANASALRHANSAPRRVAASARRAGSARRAAWRHSTKSVAGASVAENLAVIEDLCHTMKFGSLCALGGFTPYPVMSAITHFPADFGVAPTRLRRSKILLLNRITATPPPSPELTTSPSRPPPHVPLPRGERER